MLSRRLAGGWPASVPLGFPRAVLLERPHALAVVVGGVEECLLYGLRIKGLLEPPVQVVEDEVLGADERLGWTVAGLPDQVVDGFR